MGMESQPVPGRSRTKGFQGVIPVIRLLQDLLGEGVRSERHLLFMAFFLIALSTLGSLVGPFIVKEMIDRALNTGDSLLLLQYSGALILTFTLSFLCWSAHLSLAVRASERIFFRFRQRIVDAIMQKRMAFFTTHLAGYILTRMTSDLEFVSAFFLQNVLRSFAFCLFSVLLITGLILWNWILGLVFLMALPFIYLYVRRTYSSLSSRFRRAKEKLAAQNEALLDLLAGFREIRFFQQNRQVSALYQDVSREYMDVNASSLDFSSRTAAGLEFIGLLVRFAPFIVGGYLVCLRYPGMTVGMLVAYFIIFVRLSTQVFFVFQAMMTSAQVLPALERLKEILDYPLDLQVQGLGLEDAPTDTTIEMEHVSFAYPGCRAVLTDFNLQIRPGEKIAIVGPSGSGKSTLIQLLMRFLVPDQGTIRFGGKSIQDYPLPFYLSYFAYLSQNPHMFRQSVRRNVAMGWYHVPMERIEEAISLVRLREVVENLPERYATVLGKKGLSLSGGQERRLALARALIRDPEVLVLDEFTSGLDQEVGQEILGDLLPLFRRQTIICITHEKSIAQNFDRMIHL